MTPEAGDSVEQIQTAVRQFADERDWHQFHTPKNLVMALAGEVGELLEIFQWLTPEQSTAVMKNPDDAARVREEIADVGIYLLRLADVLQVDLLPAVSDKLHTNAERYPANLARGHATKYDRMGGDT